jgi:hypothetical protein
VAATIIEKKSLQPPSKLVDIDNFSKVLFDKERKVDTLLSSIYKEVKPLAKKSEFNLFEKLIDLNLKSLKDQGYILLVYVNDSLQFWSDNSIEVNQRYSKADLNNTVLNLNNAWFYVRSMHDKNLEIVGLIELRNDFHTKMNTWIIPFKKILSFHHPSKFLRYPYLIVMIFIIRKILICFRWFQQTPSRKVEAGIFSTFIHSGYCFFVCVSE